MYLVMRDGLEGVGRLQVVLSLWGLSLCPSLRFPGICPKLYSEGTIRTSSAVSIDMMTAGSYPTEESQSGLYGKDAGHSNRT